MVGPMSDAERRAGSQRLAVGFITLVGASAGIMALSGGATFVQAAAVTGAGAQGGNGEAPATATSGTPAPGDVGTPTTVGQAQAAEHADDIDTWDALTRGEDPTGD